MTLSISLGHASEQTAASIDWVVDTSGGYICQGYFSPPLIEGLSGDGLFAEAKTTDYDGNDSVILTGNVFITRNDFQLEADRVSFLNSTGDGDAYGGVRIRRPKTFLIGDTASVNVRTNAFDLRNSSFVSYENELRGDSESTIGAPNGDIYMKGGTITFCPPGSNTWDLQANHIYLSQSSGRGWADDVIIRIKEIPVFYTPTLGFPIDDRRLTGFLVPSFSLGSISGTEIVTPFYWNSAENYDLLIRPRFMTARGTAIGLHGRYLFNDFSLFETKTEQLAKDKLNGTNRHISRLTFSSSNSKAYSWNMTYENASDGTYQDDLDNFAELSDKQQLTSSIGATIRNNDWTAGWIMDRVDVVDPDITGSDQKFSRQPQLIASWANYGKDLNFFAAGDATAFTRENTGLTETDPSKGYRLSSDVKAAYPMTATFGSLTPAALGFIRWSEATLESETQDNAYFTAGASVEGGLNFDKFSEDGSVYEIVPKAKLLIREPSKDPTIIKFDTPDKANDPVTVNQIFLDNPISGGDFVGDTRELALSVTSRGTNIEGTQIYKITAGRTFFLQNRGITLTGATESSDLGPLIIESQLNLNKNFKWETRFRSVSDGETMNTATNEFKYRKSDTNYITQRTVWRDDVATRADLYVSNQTSLNWRFLAGLQWEPDNRERVNQILGTEYVNCCWRAAMVHAYERDRMTTSDGGHSVKIQFEMKGLGALGNGVSSIIDRLMEGYEHSEARY